MADDDLFVTHNQASGATRSVNREAALRSLPADSVGTGAIEDGSVTPAKRSGGSFVGIIEGSTFGSTGDKEITGVGFKPTSVEFFLLASLASEPARYGYGCADENGNQFENNGAASGSDARNRRSTSHCIGWGNANTNPYQMQASFVESTDDGFKINVNNASSTFSVGFLARR